jgi:ABC-type dipeptide/oligopeptide/nickel transport system ATPase subunit
MDSPLIAVSSLAKTYSALGEEVQALRGVDLTIGEGRVVGVVGESGSGKSTLARLVIGLERPSAGTITLRGEPLAGKRSQSQRRAIQMVFQDPRSSLNPRLSILASVEDFAAVHKIAPSRADRRQLALKALEQVHLERAVAGRRPAELSGGQLQRACIARALVVEPDLLLADEPTSSLDVSIQGQILNLLDELRHRLSILLITHDMAVVRFLADDVYVMRNGEIVESGPMDHVGAEPSHPYTARLLEATAPVEPLSTGGR